MSVPQAVLLKPVLSTKGRAEEFQVETVSFPSVVENALHSSDVLKSLSL